ncbi:MAG: hypothetical protein JWP69_1232 [Flaviaesturariibacter sp.]|nr:hypothetical protein [Flaviaesturariibacter sp.]
MRKILMGLVLFFAATISVNAQLSSEKIYKDWSNHIESKNIVDVSYRILNCNGIDQVHFLVFNENMIDQQVTFTVEINDEASKAKIVKEITFAAAKATIYKANCDTNSKTAHLKLTLPKGYNPKTTSVKVTFKP